MTVGTVQTPISQIPLGQTLLVKGIVSQDQLNIALTEQKRLDRKSTRLNSSHIQKSRMPSSA